MKSIPGSTVVNWEYSRELTSLNLFPHVKNGGDNIACLHRAVRNNPGYSCKALTVT